MGYWIIKAVLTPFLRLAFRIEVEGKERIPRKGAVIVAANHISFIDSLFLPLVLRRRVVFLAKAEYFDNPRVAWFFKLGGQIPIKREGGSAADRALASAREVLAAGGMLAIYPEGTRSPDGRLYKGRTGVARMALACDVPVLPVGLIGTAEAQPVGAMVPRPFRRVRIRIGTPMRWPELASRSEDHAVLRDVTDDVVDAIEALTGQERVDHYAKQRPDEAKAGAAAGPAAAGPVGAGPAAATSAAATPAAAATGGPAPASPVTAGLAAATATAGPATARPVTARLAAARAAGSAGALAD